MTAMDEPDRVGKRPKGRLPQEETAENDPLLRREKHLPIVGIGASAGGLAALQAFFDALPADTGMAFVVVTHMDPERESLLPELLQSHTDMAVRQVVEETTIEPNHIYVLPPNRRIVVADAHLDVEEFDEPRGRRAPIDYFFRSLAEKHREAIAIILSGGGTDGAVGVKAIKEHGGLLMVQQPDEAEHDSMPRAAINTGLADVVLPVAQLAQKLVAYRRNGVKLPQDPEALTVDELDALYRILAVVQNQTGHDFSQYKRSTVLRRIHRRMQLHERETLRVYLNYLRSHTDEAQSLFNDLLIGVTNFFRDPGTWGALAEHVIPRLFADKKQEETVRVWSIGCASGEEAYSLAILLVEYQSALEQPSAFRPNVQVFASDLDEGSLNKAREGLYPEAIEADVSQERLERFFNKEGDYYRVKRELRDLVLFSNHSVLRDPPFSRLDLISCRNLLIYLQRDLQENVFQIFHYALNPERFLFLGNSESAEMVHDLFRTVDKTHRFYQARPWRKDHPEVPTLPLSVREPARRRFGFRQAVAGPADAARMMGEELIGSVGDYHKGQLEEMAPPSALVDESHHVIHLSETAGRYLQLPRGMITSNILKLVRPELQIELRNVLYQAMEHKKSVVSRPVAVQFNGTARPVTIAVRPQLRAGDSDQREQLLLVFFLEDEVMEGVLQQLARPRREVEEGGDQETLILQMEEETQRLRERLQATTEEYESANEEMKAANEELQSINEEYRSTTEELETSKEELQSVNEELQTVNAELKNKVEEVTRAHSDMENLMAATDIATLFLDRSLQIQRYTPATTELFNIRAGDRGRPISHLTNKLAYEKLEEDATLVLDDLVPVEREVQDQDGRWLLLRLRPYRTTDHRIDGVVLTFVDITARKAVEESLREREQELDALNRTLEERIRERTKELTLEREFTEKIVNTVREGLVVLEPDLTVVFANESFYQIFRVDEEETEGRLIYELGNGQWNIPALRTLLEEILPQRNVFNGYRVAHEFEQIGRRVMVLNARRLDHLPRVLLAIEDVTEREADEKRGD